MHCISVLRCENANIFCIKLHYVLYFFAQMWKCQFSFISIMHNLSDFVIKSHVTYCFSAYDTYIQGPQLQVSSYIQKTSAAYDIYIIHTFRLHGTSWDFPCIQYNTIQYNTIQYNTIQYNTTQHNTIQYNTALCFHTPQRPQLHMSPYIPGSLNHWKSGTHPCSPVWKLPLFCSKTLTFQLKTTSFSR